MSGEPPFDARGVANLLLDIAGQKGKRPTHLVLQKLLYFAHARFLIATGKPLVSGFFEAWEHGPVHPTVYRSFRRAGTDPITFRAERVDLITGDRLTVPAPDSQVARDHLDFVMTMFGTTSAAQLREISHAKGAPWDVVVKKAQGSVTLGMRISDDLIKSCFHRHKVVVGVEPRSGEPLEDTPIAGD